MLLVQHERGAGGPLHPLRPGKMSERAKVIYPHRNVRGVPFSSTLSRRGKKSLGRVKSKGCAREFSPRRPSKLNLPTASGCHFPSARRPSYIKTPVTNPSSAGRLRSRGSRRNSTLKAKASVFRLVSEAHIEQLFTADSVASSPRLVGGLVVYLSGIIDHDFLACRRAASRWTLEGEFVLANVVSTRTDFKHEGGNASSVCAQSPGKFNVRAASEFKLHR